MARANRVQTELAQAMWAQTNGRPVIALKQVQIGTVNAAGQVTLVLPGGTVTESDVAVASNVCPIPGTTAWCMTDGVDWWVMSTLVPEGPAWGTMRKNATQSVSSGSWTTVTWGSIVDDYANGITADSFGFTAVVPGVYQVSGNFSMDSFGTTGEMYVRLTKNGTAFASGGTRAPGNSGNAARVSVSQTVKLAIGDVVTASLYQSAGTSRTTNVAAGENVLSVVWLGPSA